MKRTAMHGTIIKPYEQWTADDWEECEGDRDHPDYYLFAKVPVVAKTSVRKCIIHNWSTQFGAPDGTCHHPNGCERKAYGKTHFCYSHYYEMRGDKRTRPAKCLKRGCMNPRFEDHHLCAEHWAQRPLKRNGASSPYYMH